MRHAPQVKLQFPHFCNCTNHRCELHIPTTIDQDTCNPTTTSITWILNLGFKQCTDYYKAATDKFTALLPSIENSVHYANHVKFNRVRYQPKSYILCTDRFITRGRHGLTL